MDKISPDRKETKISSPNLWILGCIGSAIIGWLIGFFFDFICVIKPSLETTNQQIDSINCSIKGINENISSIEDRYLHKPTKGEICKVGYSADLKANTASVFIGNSLGLKKRDMLQITNEKGFQSLGLTITVDVTDRRPNNSEADIFLSKEAMQNLGITGNEIYKGIFEMQYKYIISK